MSPDPQPFALPDKPSLSFTTLPALPQAQFTDFWWPTFVLSNETRQTINQGTILTQQLDKLGKLPAFPSRPVPFPTSSVPEPLRTGNMRDITIISSTPATRNVSPRKNTAAAKNGASAREIRHTGGSISRTSTPVSGSRSSAAQTTPPPVSNRRPLDGFINFAASMIILSTFAGIICTIVANNLLNTSALDWSWALIGGSMVINLLVQIMLRKRPVLRGWLIIFLFGAIIMLIINSGIQNSIQQYLDSESLSLFCFGHISLLIQ